MIKALKALPIRCIRAGFSAVVLSAAVPFAASAQQPPERDWTFTVGAAGFYAPEFLGSKDYEFVPVPDLKVEYKNRFFASMFEGVGYNIVNSEGWRIGPIAKYAFGRDESDHIALRGLGDVDDTIELGGYAEYSFDPFSVKLEMRQGLGGHEGLVGEAGLSYSNSIETLGSPVFFSIGPRVNFANDDYNNAFFGVTAAQSAKSGLAQYKAESGLVSYGIGGFMMMPITDSISASAFAGYDRLGEEAADSPLVRQRGSEDQFIVGLGLSYQFGF